MIGNAVKHTAPIFLQIEKSQHDLQNQPLTKAELYSDSQHYLTFPLVGKKKAPSIIQYFNTQSK